MRTRQEGLTTMRDSAKSYSEALMWSVLDASPIG
jgi:hypothetical protein